MRTKPYRCQHCEVEVNSIRECEGVGSIEGAHVFVLVPPDLPRPKLVAIEGCDAAGKATQARLLAAQLGGEVVSFPDYTTPIGQLIIDHLQGRWRCIENDLHGVRRYPTAIDGDALVLQSLFTVNRLELLPRIAALLAAGKPAILDRYWLSGYVYGTLDGLDSKWLWDVHQSLPQPDMWLLLDVSAETSVKRRPERRDRYEKQEGLMAKARKLYLQTFETQMFDLGQAHWQVIDGCGSIEEVHARIRSAVRL